jgi:hypothetical protein
MTAYFRTTFTVPTPVAGVEYELWVRPILDDGAVFYINGKEALRVGMNATNVISNSSAASRTQGTPYVFEGPYKLPMTDIVYGTPNANTLAVEVHQDSITSSDMAFAAEVYVYVPALQMKLKSTVNAQGNIVISFPEVKDYKLYQSDNVQGPYAPATGVTGGTLVVPKPLPAKKFYKVQNP